MTEPESTPRHFDYRILPDELLDQLFMIFVSRPERPWLQRSWEALRLRGLTSYTTSEEYNRVLVRLATLAVIYRSWAKHAYQDECGIRDQVGEWYSVLPWIRSSDFWRLPVLSDDSSEWYAGSDRMVELMEREREAVVAAIRPPDSEGGWFAAAAGLREACLRPQCYDHDREPISEWISGEELFHEIGVTPGEFRAITVFENEFFVIDD